MSFSERLESGTFPIALEITPPATTSPEVLMRRASALGGSVSSIDVVQRSGRQNSLHAAWQLSRRGCDPIWHLVTNGASPGKITEQLQQATNKGLSQVLLVRGDNPEPHMLTGTEAIKIATETTPSIYSGVAFNQHAANLQRQIEIAAAKAEAGARYVQTQPVLDLQGEIGAFEGLRATAPGIKIVAMCMPITTGAIARRVETRLGIPVDPAFIDALETEGAELGWRNFRETIAGISRSDLIDGLVIMTFETEPDPKIGANIALTLKNVGLQGY